jgi:hypothetical protein
MNVETSLCCSYVKFGLAIPAPLLFNVYLCEAQLHITIRDALFHPRSIAAECSYMLFYTHKHRLLSCCTYDSAHLRTNRLF